MKFTSYAFISLLPIFSLNAEMILHESFDVKIVESNPVLGTHNGWQAGFENTYPSKSMVRKAYLHNDVSPFEPVGLVVQPNSTKTSCYKKLDTTLNDKTVYFSFLLRSFNAGNFSGLRFRGEKGQVIAVGLTEKAGFTGTVFGKETKSTGKGEVKTNYLILGKVVFNQDGNEAKLSFIVVDAVANVPKDIPEEWDIDLEAVSGPQTWDAVEFQAASGNTAFDDLRISTEWEDVAGE